RVSASAVLMFTTIGVSGALASAAPTSPPMPSSNAMNTALHTFILVFTWGFLRRVFDAPQDATYNNPIRQWSRSAADKTESRVRYGTYVLNAAAPALSRLR